MNTIKPEPKRSRFMALLLTTLLTFPFMSACGSSQQSSAPPPPVDDTRAGGVQTNRGPSPSPQAKKRIEQYSKSSDFSRSSSPLLSLPPAPKQARKGAAGKILPFQKRSRLLPRCPESRSLGNAPRQKELKFRSPRHCVTANSRGTTTKLPVEILLACRKLQVLFQHSSPTT